MRKLSKRITAIAGATVLAAAKANHKRETQS
jgi:hypothetical protein